MGGLRGGRVGIKATINVSPGAEARVHIHSVRGKDSYARVTTVHEPLGNETEKEKAGSR